MSDENQAQADDSDQTPVVDPLDATNSTNSGTNPLSVYEAELAAALIAEESETDTQGDEPVVSEESDDSDADDNAPKEATEETSEESSEEEEEAGTEEEAEVKAKDRFRFKDPTDQAVAAIAKAKGISLIEAAKIFEGENPTKREEEKSGETEPSETVETVSATIKDLQTQKREKLAALEFEAAAEIDEQIDDLRDKRDELKISEALAQSMAEQKANDAVSARFAETRDKWLKFYPDAKSAFDDSVEKTPMAKEILKIEAEMRKSGDPLVDHPDKAEILIKEAAYRLKIPMNKGSQPVAKNTAQHRPMQPASGNARTTATAPAVRQEEAIDRISDINAYERFVADLVRA